MPKWSGGVTGFLVMHLLFLVTYNDCNSFRNESTFFHWAGLCVVEDQYSNSVITIRLSNVSFCSGAIAGNPFGIDRELLAKGDIILIVLLN